MMAAVTASRHFMAMLGAPRPRRSERNENCSPTRAASSTRCCRRAVAVSTTSLIEDRTRAQQHDARLRAHQDVRSRGFFRCAHDQKSSRKAKQIGANTSDDTKKEHSESTYTEKSIELTNTHTCAESEH